MILCADSNIETPIRGSSQLHESPLDYPAPQIRVCNRNQNICCGYSKEPSHRDGSFEHPKHMFELMDKKIITILCKLFFLNWPYDNPLHGIPQEREKNNNLFIHLYSDLMSLFKHSR